MFSHLESFIQKKCLWSNFHQILPAHYGGGGLVEITNQVYSPCYYFFSSLLIWNCFSKKKVVLLSQPLDIIVVAVIRYNRPGNTEIERTIFLKQNKQKEAKKDPPTAVSHRAKKENPVMSSLCLGSHFFFFSITSFCAHYGSTISLISYLSPGEVSTSQGS